HMFYMIFFRIREPRAAKNKPENYRPITYARHNGRRSIPEAEVTSMPDSVQCTSRSTDLPADIRDRFENGRLLFQMCRKRRPLARSDSFPNSRATVVPTAR